MEGFARIMILAGLILVLVGFLILLSERFGFGLFRLPGDIVYRKGNTTIYFPIVSSLLLSIILSLILWLFRR